MLTLEVNFETVKYEIVWYSDVSFSGSWMSACKLLPGGILGKYLMILSL